MGEIKKKKKLTTIPWNKNIQEQLLFLCLKIIAYL